MNRHNRLRLMPACSDASTRVPRVIFDAESLMIDPTQGIQHSLKLTARDFGIDIPERWFRGCWSLRMPFNEAMAQILNTNDAQRIEEGCLRYHQHFSTDGRFRCKLRPGTLQLLAELASDADIELHYLTHIGLPAAARLLDTYGLQHLPCNVVTPEQAHCPGVRLALMEHLIDRDGGDTQNWILLSDHPFELGFAPRLRGLRTIGIGYARLSMAMLSALQPDAIAAHPGEIVSLLRRNHGSAGVHAEVASMIH